MEKSTHLDLNLLENNDYAGHWDVPINENFELIDDKVLEIATELLHDPTVAYAGKLKKSCASLEDRLNVAMDNTGNIIFNNGDLESSRYAREARTTGTVSIYERLNRLDEKDFVKDALDKSLAAASMPTGTVATDGVYAKHMDSRSGILAPSYERQKYSVDGVDLDNFYFRCKEATDLIYVNPADVDDLMITGLGLMQIGGRMYNHTREVHVPMTALTELYYRIYATQKIPSIVDLEFIDCQLTRSSATTGLPVMNIGLGASTVSCIGVGLDTWPGVTNKWVPTAGDILRVYEGAVPHDYQIKTVSNDSLEIFGKFAEALTGVTWAIYDFTQPCLYIHEISAPGRTTEDMFMDAFDKRVDKLNIAYVHRTGVASEYRTTFDNPIVKTHQSGIVADTTRSSRYVLWQPDYTADGKLTTAGAGYTSDFITLTDVAVGRIKGISVICLESINDTVGHTKRYILTINPTRQTTVGALQYFLSSYQTYMVAQTDDSTTNTIEYHASKALPYSLFLQHPEYNDAGGGRDGWALSYLTASYTLEFLAVLIELM